MIKNKGTKNMTNANNEEEVEVKVNNVTPRNRRMMWIIVAAAVVVLLAGLFAAYSHIQSQKAIEALRLKRNKYYSMSLRRSSSRIMMLLTRALHSSKILANTSWMTL
jgi:heme/copper-type cytochrome/quinol oxidase subunit 3